MRIRRRQKSKKVRKSFGRSMSKSMENATPKQSNGTSFKSSPMRKHLSKAQFRRLLQKKRKNQKASALLALYSALEKRNSGLKVLSKPVVENNANIDDIPTTSKQAAAVMTTTPMNSTGVFLHNTGINNNRILNNSKKNPILRRHQLRLKRLNSSTNSSTASQIATRKLLRSIKRHQNRKFVQNTSPRRIGLERRRQFNFSKEKVTECKPININASLEEGEIASEPDCTLENDKNSDTLNNDNDENKDADTANDSDGETDSTDDDIDDESEDDENDDSNTGETDEDCVYVAPKIELITIDDDTVQTTVPNRKNLPKKTQMIISTPLEKSKSKLNTDFTKMYVDNNSHFFKDTSSQKMFETITSADNFSDYATLSTLRSGKGMKRRRSERLRRGTKATSLFDSALTNDDVILVDDSTLKPDHTTTETSEDSNKSSIKDKCNNIDDSVIFVSETNPNRLEFIPLESDDVPNPIPYESPPRQSRTRLQNNQNDLFTKSERKQINVYNGNAYNPCSDDVKEVGKRMVLIDGCNVAFSHSLNKEFSVKGLKICLEYFEKMGHEVKAVVPQFRINKYKSSKPEELVALHRAGKIVLTPCKNLPGAKTSSYDDRFVLQLACELDAAIVSNDNYRDLINENSAFKKIIENRVIGYTWCNDIFILPKDPYGKWGPDLQTILNRK